MELEYSLAPKHREFFTTAAFDYAPYLLSLILLSFWKLNKYYNFKHKYGTKQGLNKCYFKAIYLE